MTYSSKLVSGSAESCLSSEVPFINLFQMLLPKVTKFVFFQGDYTISETTAKFTSVDVVKFPRQTLTQYQKLSTRLYTVMTHGMAGQFLIMDLSVSMSTGIQIVKTHYLKGRAFTPNSYQIDVSYYSLQSRFFFGDILDPRVFQFSVVSFGSNSIWQHKVAPAGSTAIALGATAVAEYQDVGYIAGDYGPGSLMVYSVSSTTILWGYRLDLSNGSELKHHKIDQLRYFKGDQVYITGIFQERESLTDDYSKSTDWFYFIFIDTEKEASQMMCGANKPIFIMKMAFFQSTQTFRKSVIFGLDVNDFTVLFLESDDRSTLGMLGFSGNRLVMYFYRSLFKSIFCVSSTNILKYDVGMSTYTLPVTLPTSGNFNANQYKKYFGYRWSAPSSAAMYAEAKGFSIFNFGERTQFNYAVNTNQMYLETQSPILSDELTAYNYPVYDSSKAGPVSAFKFVVVFNVKLNTLNEEFPNADDKRIFNFRDYFSMSPVALALNPNPMQPGEAIYQCSSFPLGSTNAKTAEQYDYDATLGKYRHKFVKNINDFITQSTLQTSKCLINLSSCELIDAVTSSVCGSSIVPASHKLQIVSSTGLEIAFSLDTSVPYSIQYQCLRCNHAEQSFLSQVNSKVFSTTVTAITATSCNTALSLTGTIPDLEVNMAAQSETSVIAALGSSYITSTEAKCPPNFTIVNVASSGAGSSFLTLNPAGDLIVSTIAQGTKTASIKITTNYNTGFLTTNQFHISICNPQSFIQVIQPLVLTLSSTTGSGQYASIPSGKLLNPDSEIQVMCTETSRKLYQDNIEFTDQALKINAATKDLEVDVAQLRTIENVAMKIQYGAHVVTSTQFKVQVKCPSLVTLKLNAEYSTKKNLTGDFIQIIASTAYILSNPSPRPECQPKFSLLNEVSWLKLDSNGNLFVNIQVASSATITIKYEHESIATEISTKISVIEQCTFVTLSQIKSPIQYVQSDSNAKVTALTGNSYIKVSSLLDCDVSFTLSAVNGEGSDSWLMVNEKNGDLSLQQNQIGAREFVVKVNSVLGQKSTNVFKVIVTEPTPQSVQAINQQPKFNITDLPPYFIRLANDTYLSPKAYDSENNPITFTFSNLPFFLETETENTNFTLRVKKDARLQAGQFRSSVTLSDQVSKNNPSTYSLVIIVSSNDTTPTADMNKTMMIIEPQVNNNETQELEEIDIQSPVFDNFTFDSDFLKNKQKQKVKFSGSIDRKGLCVLTFQNKIGVPNWMQGEGRRRRLQTEILFEQFKDIVFEFEMVENEDKPTSGSGPITFNSTFKKFIQHGSESKFEIQLNMSRPLDVSIGSKKDQMIIKIAGSNFLQYFPEALFEVDLEQKLFISIPPQKPHSLAQSYQVAEAETQATSVQIMNGVMITNVFLGFFLGAVLSSVWSLANILQIIAHYPLVNIVMPANSQELLELVNMIATFDLVPEFIASPILDFIFDLPSDIPFNEKFAEMNYSTSYIIQTMFTQLCILIVGSLYYLLQKCITVQCKNPERKRKARQNLYHVYAFYLRLLAEVCLDICIIGSVEIIMKQTHTWSEIFSFNLSVVCFELLFIMFLQFLLVACCHHDKILSPADYPEFHRKWSVVWEDQRIKHQKPMYLINFMLRRIIFAFLIVKLTLDGFPVSIQLMFIIYLNFFHTINIFSQKQFIDRRQNWVENFNELCNLMISELILINALSKDGEMLYQGGNVINYLLIFLFCVNLLAILIKVVEEVIRKRRIRFSRMRKIIELELRLQTQKKLADQITAPVNLLEIGRSSSEDPSSEDNSEDDWPIEEVKQDFNQKFTRDDNRYEIQSTSVSQLIKQTQVLTQQQLQRDYMNIQDDNWSNLSSQVQQESTWQNQQQRGGEYQITADDFIVPDRMIGRVTVVDQDVRQSRFEMLIQDEGEEVADSYQSPRIAELMSLDED